MKAIQMDLSNHCIKKNDLNFRAIATFVKNSDNLILEDTSY